MHLRTQQVIEARHQHGPAEHGVHDGLEAGIDHHILLLPGTAGEPPDSLMVGISNWILTVISFSRRKPHARSPWTTTTSGTFFYQRLYLCTKRRCNGMDHNVDRAVRIA